MGTTLLSSLATTLTNEMRRTKVRFNLGRGENYMKWKVEGKDGSVYLDPEKFNLVMSGCKLHSNRTSAERIYKGEAKRVCAWILCDSVEISEMKVEGGEKVSYNPRVEPNWVYQGTDVDGMMFDSLVTSGRSVLKID